MSSESKLIPIGIISSPYGIRGQVAIKSFTDPASNILNYELKDYSKNIIKIHSAKILSKKIICNIDQIVTRTAAEQLTCTKLYIYKHELPQLSDSEYYVANLNGIKVKNLAGETIGKINNICNYNAGDIIEVVYNDGKKIMYPFTNEIFPQITEDFVVIVPPEFI
ncbi:16S rRNA processing protein RimM [Orientia tsutsugamushi str. UT144]|uniref:Ribosome maturation factor RimM n=1 Tax=Orientia tsutsugamushi str. UT144 TaxID=1441384 RepID=A0A0F3RQX9_ORITS|nr:ribosome maturation factor RimM [Orientia tsutsugamushi]KJW07544.1 16S rRNA processing protein RimM [Orientia tsutsugamushi str. UT144]